MYHGGVELNALLEKDSPWFETGDANDEVEEILVAMWLLIYVVGHEVSMFKKEYMMLLRSCTGEVQSTKNAQRVRFYNTGAG